MQVSQHPRFRFIRSQGDLDGACFLYSLANAVQTLTRRQIQAKDWSFAVQSLAAAADYLDNTKGSAQSDGNRSVQESLAKELLQRLAPLEAMTVKTIVNLKNGTLDSATLNESTVIVCSNKQHWFCIVDSDDDHQHAYVACSWVWQRDPAQYAERVSPNFERVYNDSVAFADIEYFKKRAFAVRTQ